MAPTPKPAPQSKNELTPKPPDGWDKNPVHVQIENNEKRMTIKFPNIDALAGWLADAINR